MEKRKIEEKRQMTIGKKTRENRKRRKQNSN